MCFYPIRLKSGECVPCGHCQECYKARRNDWSVRLQLHTLDYDKMPLFITLTYAPKFLPPNGVEKKDLQNYIKSIRDKYGLYNSDFSYYACGEYGENFTCRAHYHILMFGMSVYEDAFEISDLLCQSIIEKDWKKGECFACRAEWSGIHYVTKYCLKFLDKDWNHSENMPFCLASKGIGKGFINSNQFKYVRSCCNVNKYREVLDSCPELDLTDYHTIYSTSSEILSKLQPFVESANIVLPSGKRVMLPRYFRKKLYGSYEHWLLNPFCYYRYVQRMNRFAKDALHGFKGNDRILVKEQEFHKKLMCRGHIVKPTNNRVFVK